jgi:TonB-linked SusC/RagA family outer membrane protein
MNKILLNICIVIGLSCCLDQDAFAQTDLITGTVYDEVKGRVFPGATVMLVNRNDLVLNGVSADATGKFRIKRTPDAVKIKFSYIGYKPQEFTLGSKNGFEVILMPAQGELDEVAIMVKKAEKADMGMLSIDKKESSSAIARVDLTDLRNAPVTNIEQLIQGNAPGLQITAASGDPGAAATVRIRGVSSISGINDPLWIVDGREVIGNDFNVSSITDFGFSPIGDIDPSDIESIEVLKDASATALYGSRGSNGVIVIKTKRGKQGKPVFSLSSKFTSTQVPNTIPMMSGDDQRIFSIESFRSGVDDGSFLQELRGDLTREDAWKYNNNTDWMDAITRNGFNQQYNANLSGGGERVRYYWGVGYTNQYGTTKGTGYDRFNNVFNIDYRVSNKLKISADLSYTNSLTDKRGQRHPVNESGLIESENNTDIGAEISPITYAREIAAYFPIYTRNGLNYFVERAANASYTSRYNPVSIIDYSTNLTKANRFQASTAIDYNIVKNLDFRSQIGVDFRESSDEYFLPGYATAALPGEVLYNAGLEGEGVQLLLTTTNRLSWAALNKTNHRLMMTGVLKLRAETFNSTLLSYNNGSSPHLRSSDAAALITAAEGKFGDEREAGLIVHGHYGWRNRVFITTSANLEANSRQGKDNPYIIYPTLGFAWDMAKEEFLSLPKWINHLKPRFSFGISGNLPRRLVNLTDVAYSTGTGYMGDPYTYPSKLAYDNIKPETSTEFNYGLDFHLFNNSIEASVDYYNKTTDDLLLEETISSTLGFSKQWINFGSVRNSGVEFGITAVIKEPTKTGLSWRTQFNIATNQNKLLSLPENLDADSWQSTREGFVSKLQAGDVIGAYYGYRALGVYPRDEDAILRDNTGNVIFQADGITPKQMRFGSNTGHLFRGGDMIYDDINGDGIINELDKVQIGNSSPLFFGGWNNTFNYRNLQLLVQFEYKYGHDAINLSRKNVEKMNDSRNQAQSVTARWRKQGDISDIPRAQRLANWNQEASTRWVEDASYLRLRSVSLSYNFDRKLVSKLGLKNASVFLTSYNLYTWTNYLGVDPEVPINGNITMPGVDNNTTAPPRQFTLGFRATL